MRVKVSPQEREKGNGDEVVSGKRKKNTDQKKKGFESPLARLNIKRGQGRPEEGAPLEDCFKGTLLDYPEQREAGKREKRQAALYIGVQQPGKKRNEKRPPRGKYNLFMDGFFNFRR